jgi:hypothetical protein
VNAATKSQLAEIDANLNRNLADQAMRNLIALVRRLSYEELTLAMPDVEALVARFLHKRQRELRSVLQSRLSAGVGTPTAVRDGAAQPRVGTSDHHAYDNRVGAKTSEYTARLNELRDRHIFQWSTSYRETVNYLFKDLTATTAAAQRTELSSALSALLENHSHDIFQRGFNYITGTLSAATDVAIAKSVSGLQRFLFLVIDSYSNAASAARSKDEALAVRAVSSGMLAGILKGYGRVRLGPAVGGWDLLQKYPSQWAHAIAFMTSSDLQRVLDVAPGCELKDDLLELVVPCQLAIDRMILALPPNAKALPRVGRFSQYPARFEVTLASPSVSGRATVRVITLLGEPQVEPLLIDETLASGATAVVARIGGELWQASEEAWTKRVIDATRVGSVDDLIDNVAERIGAVMGEALVEAPPSGVGPRVLSHNVAGDFPLRDPIVRQFYLVQRHSVRQLLNTFAEGTGTLVWCSVRRSGKTTATLELSGDTDRSVVVIQTMDHQPAQPDLNVFSARVLEALGTGKAIDAHFFEGVVSECALASSPAGLRGNRKVFIVDEYETLFGLLNAKAKQDDWSRFAVIQPLLSQMVAFSTSNLLIFLGQRPDAHAILMSQNQLSPLVRQDSFPLFEHLPGSTSTEFAQFVGRVLAEIGVSAGFIDSVYEETSGHPYLTVNMMVDLCDWLIANHRPASGLRLETDDMEAFTRDRLSPAVLQRSPYYATFQQMLADSLSEATRSAEPWLHAVTLVMQRICRQHPRALSCPEPKYREIAADAARLANAAPGQLLQAAKMANFLVNDVGHVKPAIRILGRLAAVSAAEVN